MKVERSNNEILVRLSSNIDLAELQDMLDYLKYRELTANSTAIQKDADELANEVNSVIWNNMKKQRKL